ncbi:hypothetical protein HMPREF3293_01747 [Christensenella minuta]|uniref:Uncharacterized protein n=1 Tax=Christensenella minuta TaxID=626937 RepID=A0A136Q4C9_9FIRM|nr:hypothetical protein HMPREF3293_01747 [Christensenella minuta]
MTRHRAPLSAAVSGLSPGTAFLFLAAARRFCYDNGAKQLRVPRILSVFSRFMRRFQIPSRSAKEADMTVCMEDLSGNRNPRPACSRRFPHAPFSPPQTSVRRLTVPCPARTHVYY